MANYFAVANGNFNQASTWSSTPGGVGGFGVPGSIDVAISNNKTVTITADITVSELRSDSTGSATAGGSFTLNNSITINANNIYSTTAGTDIGTVNYSGTLTSYIYANIITFNDAGAASGRYGVYHTGSGNLYIVGNITTNTATTNNLRTFVSTSTGEITIIGNILSTASSANDLTPVLLSNCSKITIVGNLTSSTGTTSNACRINTNNCTIKINGILLPGFAGNTPDALSISGNNNNIFIEGIVSSNTAPNCVRSCGLYANNLTNSTINIVGSVTGGSIGVASNVYACGVLLDTGFTGQINIKGDVTSGNSTNNRNNAGLFVNSSNAIVNIIGNIISFGSCGLVGINGTTCNIKGSIINGADGIPAVFAPNFIVSPADGAINYIRYAKDGTGISDDSYQYQFTSDSFTTFSSPPVSSVRTGILYSGVSIGTCNMPQPSAVAYGTVYDSNNSKFGLAINRDNVIFNTLLNNLSVINSVGDRVKKSSTTEATGHLIASFSN